MMVGVAGVDEDRSDTTARLIRSARTQDHDLFVKSDPPASVVCRQAARSRVGSRMALDRGRRPATAMLCKVAFDRIRV
jgi:hypothetical protein